MCTLLLAEVVNHLAVHVVQALAGAQSDFDKRSVAMQSAVHLLLKSPPRTIAQCSDAGREGLLRLIGVWAIGDSTHIAADGYCAASA